MSTMTASRISATEVPHLRREIPNSNKALYIYNITDDTEIGDRDFENSRRFCRAQVIPNPRSNNATAVNLSLVEIKSAEEDDAVISMDVLGYSNRPGKGFAVIGHSTGGGEPWEWGDGTPFAEWKGEAIDGAYTNWEGQLREGFPWNARECDPDGCPDRLCVSHKGVQQWSAQACVTRQTATWLRIEYVICQGPLDATDYTYPATEDPLTGTPELPVDTREVAVDVTEVHTTPVPSTGAQLPPLPFIIALSVLCVAVVVVAALVGWHRAKADNGAEETRRRRRDRTRRRRMRTDGDEVAALEQQSTRSEVMLGGTVVEIEALDRRDNRRMSTGGDEAVSMEGVAVDRSDL